MRNPNGYGTVVKLKGNRRKPYVVRKTKGWNEKKHPIYNIIGYCATREEAMILLAQYNHEPWNVDKTKTTFEELYKLWCEKKAPKLGDSNRKSMQSAYKHCEPLYKMKYKAIKSSHMQACIDGCGRGATVQATIKNLFRHLDRFALELDLIIRRYSELLKAETAPETNRQTFSEEEIGRVWANADTPWMDSVIAYLYTGFRLTELLNMKITDVDIIQRTMQGGIKTKSGKGRIVPIHNKLLPFIKKRVEEGNEYLFENKGKRITVSGYYVKWRKMMSELDINLTPHECRHTFISRLDSAGANRRCIDLLAGHKSREVGMRVYTHKTLEELRQTIDLLP